MFEGLSAFPLTPYDEAGPDLELLSEIVGGLADAGVDSICALGSTRTGCSASPRAMHMSSATRAAW